MTGPAELAVLAARFAAAVRAAGLPVGPDRAARFARAVVEVSPSTNGQLRGCALATLVSDPAHIAVLDEVFGTVFGTAASTAGWGQERPSELDRPASGEPGEAAGRITRPRGVRGGSGAGRDRPARALASDLDRLATVDFADLTAAELAALASAMGRFRLATPPRRSRRSRPAAHGPRVDLRATLRAARRTGGDPVRLARSRRRERPRRLVVLCDISGSMEPYARALLQLLSSAGGGARAEVFTFATRLTRLTPALTPAVARHRPAEALRRAALLPPDWSGGTRIGSALKHFTDSYGARGLARGAVILIISDGWETGDVERLGVEMARLSRLAHRIVWANPRTRDPGYRPLVGGMAAAWPYCHAVVSAHRLAALDELVDALRGR